MRPCGEVAEWSKALRPGRSLFGGVGSNPTLTTFCVTLVEKKRPLAGSNRRPSPYGRDALTTELKSQTRGSLAQWLERLFSKAKAGGSNPPGASFFSGSLAQWLERRG